MNTLPNKQLQEWIRKRKADLTPDGVISRIELWHVIDGEGGEPLSTYLMEDRPEDEDPDDLTQEIWNEAEEDAATRPQGSFQRYAVRAFRGDASMPEENKAFLCSGRAITSLIGSDSESASPRGLIAQERRQNDNLHAMVIRMCEGMAGHLERRTKEQNDEISSLYRERRALFDLEQKLKDREHERALEREEKQRSAERLDTLMTGGLTMLQTLGPLILGKLLSGPAPAPGALSAPIPGQLHPRAAAAMARDVSIRHVLESLEPDQLKVVIGTLKPEQQLAFMEIYGSYRDEQERTDVTEESSHDQETH
jgi:hypothetical protein